MMAFEFNIAIIHVTCLRFGSLNPNIELKPDSLTLVPNPETYGYHRGHSRNLVHTWSQAHSSIAYAWKIESLTKHKVLAKCKHQIIDDGVLYSAICGMYGSGMDDHTYEQEIRV
ncbi:hypothetical protein L1987_37371 [Smallanthus sonchifolius]|uniref:Uncharacterized protein n=1 Tax=Smallanthus sonchifolius TaxID=185202 RepID=A0ACB9HG66_9ASTR|nr:hypothetical protein L1987_37371 [Smallanthus sonchifolius]